jgi:hypothetical protein
MASKLTIKEEHGGENMPLYYAVYDETGRQISMHYAREDAEFMAAAPLMLETLEHVAAVYRNSIGFPASAFRAVMPNIEAAIAAAKGE